MTEAVNNLYQYKPEPKCEKHNGKVVAMAPSANLKHNRAVGNLFFIFKSYLKGKPCKVYLDGADVYITENDIFIPDLSVVCNLELIKNDRGIFGAPDLVAEVLSRSTQIYDKNYKKSVYEKAGVKEYWIVDIEHRSVEVFLQKDGAFKLDYTYVLLDPEELEDIPPERKADFITEFSPSMFPDLIISLEEVFEGIS